MALLFYSFLHKIGMSDDAKSHGIHFATRQPRDSWVQRVGYGENVISDVDLLRDVVACDDLELQYPLWIPYVQYGV